MKRVSLVRHAKAVAANLDQDDFDRPLAARGQDDASALGRTTDAMIPDLVLCSPARRTRETISNAAAQWAVPPQVIFEKMLYLAEWENILDALKHLPAALVDVWVVGHNPGLHELAIEFARRGGEEMLDSELGRHFPTAARAVFTFDTDDWKNLSKVPTHFMTLVTKP